MKYDVSDNFKRAENVPSDLILGDFENVKNPYFSVVIPTYNRPNILKEAVMSAVKQEGFKLPYEIIVVDNENTEGENETEKMLRELNIDNLCYYKNRKNLGACGNWNRCIMLARSNWVIMCHDDDWIKVDCLSTMYQIIKKHEKDRKQIGYIRSSAESWYDPKLKNYREPDRQARPKKKRTALIKQTYSNVIWGGGATWAGAPTCGTLLNKEAVISVGGYNPELTPCFDCYVPYHMLGKYAVYKTYYSLGKYRWSENDTYRKETLLGLIKAYNEFLEILAKKHILICFFSDEHYADCVNYYRSKGKEAGIVISDQEIAMVRPLVYSRVKLKLLYICRRINSVFKVITAK